MAGERGISKPGSFRAKTSPQSQLTDKLTADYARCVQLELVNVHGRGGREN